MKLSTEQCAKLSKGLNAMVIFKELEIKEIKEKTEKDYESEKQLGELVNETFSLEVCQEREIAEVKQEIKELQDLRDMINTSSNHVLVIPSLIQLQLSEV